MAGATREEMLAAMGIDPSAGLDPSATARAPDGPVGSLIGDSGSVASDRASRIYKALGVAAKQKLDPVMPYMPGIDAGITAANGIVNPLSLAGAALSHPAGAKRAGEVAVGLPRPGDPVGNVTSTGPIGTELRPMNTGVDVQAAPSLASQGSPARGQGGYGMGGGIGRGALDAAQRSQMDLIGRGADIELEMGGHKVDRVNGVSDIGDANAARMQRDAEDQQIVDQKATAKQEAFLARQEQLANELATKRVDPSRLLRNADFGTQFTMGLGAALGGGNAMLNGSSGNISLDRLDKLVDRDIQAQITDIDSAKSSYNARSTLFGQMLSETGDRRLAAMQTRSLMYDAMKLKAKSDADRLGIPEIRDNAALLANEIDQKQAALKTQIETQHYQSALSAAAAAQAAARAAEDKAWQRGQDIQKMALEQRKLDIEQQKALGGGSDGAKADAAALGEVTKRLADDDVVKNRALIRSLNSKIRPDGSIVGLDSTTTAKRALGGMIPGVGLSSSTVDRVALSDDERIARQEYEQLRLLFQQKITGAGGSPEQMEDIRKAFVGAGSSAEKTAAIRKALSELDRRENLAQSSLTDGQKAELRRRQERDGSAEARPRAASTTTEEPANPWLRKGK